MAVVAVQENENAINKRAELRYIVRASLYFSPRTSTNQSLIRWFVGSVAIDVVKDIASENAKQKECLLKRYHNDVFDGIELFLPVHSSSWVRASKPQCFARNFIYLMPI